MAFIRKIKKGKNTYLAKVESYRQDGKIKQRVLEYLGKEIDGKPVKKIFHTDVEVEASKEYLDYKVLYELAKELELDQMIGSGYEYIFLIFISQLVTKRSLYKLPEHHQKTCLMDILGISKIDNKVLFNTLDKIQELDFQEIEHEIFLILKKFSNEKEAMVIDLTDTYFNGSKATWKSRKGKDGKYDKLIQIALAVTKSYGFPIFHKTYEGNISNIKIFEDIITDIRLKNFNLIIMDRGMLCNKSLLDLHELDQAIIAGLKLNPKLKKKFLSNINRDEIYHPNNRVTLKKTEVFINSFNYEYGKLIVVYNPELETHKRRHAMKNEKTYSSEKAKYYGYSLIINTSDIDDKEAVKMYYEKDIVEKSYKELKSTINLHPIRKYLLTHVQAHIKISYLSYIVLSYFQYKVRKLNISAVEALKKLAPVHKIELKSEKNNLRWSKTVTLKREQAKILKALGCSV